MDRTIYCCGSLINYEPMGIYLDCELVGIFQMMNSDKQKLKSKKLALSESKRKSKASRKALCDLCFFVF